MISDMPAVKESCLPSALATVNGQPQGRESRPFCVFLSPELWLAFAKVRDSFPCKTAVVKYVFPIPVVKLRTAN